MNAIENVQAIRLDVTLQEEVDAGVVSGGPLLENDESDIRWLFDPNPKLRYMVVPNRDEALWTIAATLRRVAQRNERQEHAFSREELGDSPIQVGRIIK